MKWCDKIGFVIEAEDPTNPGVYDTTSVEKTYFGDMNKNYRRLQSWESPNDKIVLNNELSIIADAFAANNFHSIRYVKFMGTNWKVTGVEVESPRLVLTLGGEYTNG